MFGVTLDTVKLVYAGVTLFELVMIGVVVNEEVFLRGFPVIDFVKNNVM